MTAQQPVQRAIEELAGSGAETGLQVAAVHAGEWIVHAAAGTADLETGRPMTPDTPVFSFSTVKGMTSLIAHLLVRDGLIGYDTPVAQVWPEFGAHGKEAATLRHVLTHTAGLPAMPAEVGPTDLADTPGIAARLARAEPLWPPGSRTGYHSYTFGFLVGEIARRITGKPMGQLLSELIATPLGLSGELYYGVPPADLPRLARLTDAAPPAAPPEGILAPWERGPSAAMGNDPAVLTADIPSVGTVTARGIATVYAAIVDGRLISPDQLAELSAPAFDGVDQVFGNPARLALGYPLGRLGDGTPTTFGWAGGGGSYACADVSSATAFAITKNRLTPDFATAQRITELIAAQV
ncbi:MAG TPA: serine hydrolase domain-containing protein [Mycobacteriales bacterium]|nr:serine hydrolase domain-containing protein [Mycobacteriales bacterium]